MRMSTFLMFAVSCTYFLKNFLKLRIIPEYKKYLKSRPKILERFCLTIRQNLIRGGGIAYFACSVCPPLPDLQLDLPQGISSGYSFF